MVEAITKARELIEAIEAEAVALEIREWRDTKANQERFNEANCRVGRLSYEFARNVAPFLASLEVPA